MLLRTQSTLRGLTQDIHVHLSVLPIAANHRSRRPIPVKNQDGCPLKSSPNSRSIADPQTCEGGAFRSQIGKLIEPKKVETDLYR